MAAANHKLTTLLNGRTIAGFSADYGNTELAFTDGSRLSLRLASGSAAPPTATGTVDKVRQSVDPPELFLDLQDGSTISLSLAEATSCVLLRDGSGALEYAD